MYDILDRYGIKEVADVTFYEINEDGFPVKPVLYLDTLKVSTIEQTAEQVDAVGGKGNVPLITWDYGKEITVTLEDALFSPKSLAIMYGDAQGHIQTYANETDTASTGEKGSFKLDSLDSVTATSDSGTINLTDDQHPIGESALIMKSEMFQASEQMSYSDFIGKLINEAAFAGQQNIIGWDSYFKTPQGQRWRKINPRFFDVNGTEIKNSGNFEKGRNYFCTYDLSVNASVITISADTFPGVYYITGDTYARSEVTGQDQFFQFIIPKAKVSAENTLTLEAEGDPTVFNMNLRVLRDKKGEMMKLVQYNPATDVSNWKNGLTEESVDKFANLVHNHRLDEKAEYGAAG